MADLLALLLIGALLSAATKTGRDAVRNFARSAHTATGWRTPRAALHHFSGRAGDRTGRGVAGAARRGRLAGGWLGRKATTTAGRRWHARQAAGDITPPVWRTGGDGSAGPTRRPDGKPGTAADKRFFDLRESGYTGPVDQDGNIPSATAGTGTPPEPASSSPSPATTAPAGADRRHTRMATRYMLNLEPPQTDGEFLESCVQLGDVLKSLAEEISTWADGLGSLNLPQSVLNPLHQVSDGITDAAAGATQAAKAFEDEFEDARDVAARGMHFTGQDAA